jgi:methylmalonyl-CoA mutase N-terminal domain/subunit
MNRSGYLDAYFEKPARLRTWSGLDVKPVYGPEDAAGEYRERLGDPGEYPYTRGIHRNMYRGRFWTRREVCGFGTPAETNQRMRFLLAQGVSGLNVIFDIPTMGGMDADTGRTAGGSSSSAPTARTGSSPRGPGDPWSRTPSRGWSWAAARACTTPT